MKKIVLISFFMLLSACAHAQEPSASVDILKKALAYGKLQELNRLSSHVDKSLMLRLYEIPLTTKDCFMETEGVCQNQYLLSISTIDENPEVSVFKLKTEGEITKIEWLPVTQIDYAELVLQVSQYTKTALENNPKLQNKTSTVILKVGLEKLVELTL